MKNSKIHLLLLLLWILLIVPTLIYWRDSILWIIFMSLYANISTHWSAYEGAKGKEATESGQTI